MLISIIHLVEINKSLNALPYMHFSLCIKYSDVDFVEHCETKGKYKTENFYCVCNLNKLKQI